MQDILKLKASGIVTVLGIQQTPRKNLMKIKVSAFGGNSVQLISSGSIRSKSRASDD